MLKADLGHAAPLGGALAEGLRLGQALAAGASELAQRLAILLTDVLLLVFAVLALGEDWGRSCESPLHSYGAACIALCCLDFAMEILRCSSESTLDRLQADSQSREATPAGQGSDSLLGLDDRFCQGVVGQPRVHIADVQDGSPLPGSLGRGVLKEKALRQRRAYSLQFWSVLFTCLVSLVFSCFAAHDEECAEFVPSLYNYIHAFAYVYALRIGTIMLWLCCRTVKNYEDAAYVANANPRRQAPPPLHV
mmetsp:Transcript_58729/g.157340  ORF Transcript_58729/g.157340 Transcript_58729/m.157340 type:complete len:250 (-) Transcript_58729:79-828(-)